MKFKITKQRRARIAGFCGIILGLYMILALKEKWGILPATLGLGLVLWRFNGKR